MKGGKSWKGRKRNFLILVSKMQIEIFIRKFGINYTEKTLV